MRSGAGRVMPAGWLLPQPRRLVVPEHARRWHRHLRLPLVRLQQQGDSVILVMCDADGRCVTGWHEDVKISVSSVTTLAWNSTILSSGSRDKSILQHDIRVPNDYISKNFWPQIKEIHSCAKMYPLRKTRKTRDIIEKPRGRGMLLSNLEKTSENIIEKLVACSCTQYPETSRWIKLLRPYLWLEWSCK